MIIGILEIINKNKKKTKTENFWIQKSQINCEKIWIKKNDKKIKKFNDVDVVQKDSFALCPSPWTRKLMAARQAPLRKDIFKGRLR